MRTSGPCRWSRTASSWVSSAPPISSRCWPPALRGSEESRGALRRMWRWPRRWSAHVAPLEDADLEEQRGALDEAGDDLAVEVRHRVQVRLRGPVAETEARAAVAADVVPGEALIEQGLHPRVSLLRQLDDGGALDATVGAQAHGHAHRTMERELGYEDGRRHQPAARVPAQIEAIEGLDGGPAG